MLFKPLRADSIVSDSTETEVVLLAGLMFGLDSIKRRTAVLKSMFKAAPCVTPNAEESTDW
jgi:hypothetical protein